MKKWNASMPRHAPEAGCSHVVYAFKKVNGTRMEIEGELNDADAQELMSKAIGMLNNRKSKDLA